MFYQYGLLEEGAARVPDRLGTVDRLDLGHGAWLDWAPSWLPGSDSWFDQLRRDLPWQSHRRPMYDRVVDVPRLTCSFAAPDDPAVPTPIRALAGVLGAAYRPIEGVGANWYRHGRDSVAFHPDKVPFPGDSVVAIVAIGERRPFLIRPLRGGPARRFDFGRGDLLVMGGTCQAFFEHAVPKVARDTTRISVMFRS